MKEYTREELISICERSFVPQSKWRNRDSCISQISTGECYALLKAGCKFKILREKDGLNTNHSTIWLKFWVKNFSWFESCDDENSEGYEHENSFYLPTPERLNLNKNGDWY